MILGVSPKLMSDAQKHGLAGRRLLNVMENITTRAVPSFRHGLDSSLAMETFSIKPLERFDGISCSWYDKSLLLHFLILCLQNENFSNFRSLIIHK